MKNMAVHMRISRVDPSDADVDSRQSAATALAAKWGKEKESSAIITRAVDIAAALGGNGKPSTTLGNEVQTAIQKKSSSYLFDERPLDVGVCAGMAMVSILESRGTGDSLASHVYAVALWSALAYQPVLEDEKRESLRSEVLEAARGYATDAAEKSRERGVVPDPSAVEIELGEDNVITNNVEKAVSPAIDVLRRNAALDGEELDFLWWAQLGRSRLLNKQLSALAEPIRILAAGIEGAEMLRRLPCQVHHELVLRTLDKDPELDLAGILTAIGDDRNAFSAAIIKVQNPAHPSVFPLLHALTTGETSQSGSSVSRRVSEWGGRALLEVAFAKMLSKGTIKL